MKRRYAENTTETLIAILESSLPVATIIYVLVFHTYLLVPHHSFPPAVFFSSAFFFDLKTETGITESHQTTIASHTVEKLFHTHLFPAIFLSICKSIHSTHRKNVVKLRLPYLRLICGVLSGVE